MSQILDPQARERCEEFTDLREDVSSTLQRTALISAISSVDTVSRIALVRPERARSLEQLIVRMARSGQIRGRVNDEQLLSLLDQVARAEEGGSSGGGSSSRSKITVSGERTALSRWEQNGSHRARWTDCMNS